MSWLYSRALVEAYSEENCSVGGLSVLLKLTPTVRAYLPSDKTTESWSPSRYGMTCERLRGSLGEAVLTWFRAAFRVKTSQALEKAQESQENDQVFGQKWQELSVKLDRALSLWRIRRFFGYEVLPWSSKIWPFWGMMRNGSVYQRVTAKRPISGIVSGLLPTPCSTDADRGGRGELLGMIRGTKGYRGKQWPTPVAKDDGKTPEAHMRMKKNMPGGERKTITSLTVMVKAMEQGKYQELWPTPLSAPTSKKSHNQFSGRFRQALKDKGIESPGQLNPTWVEWLMGWPIGWTDLKPLAMDKFQEWQQQHGLKAI